ncbi:protein phosphatase 2C domain-containing protein [Georgenia sp. Z1344]|uniref:protein phosphatase 2C domain-containing protein n=1 Tax=Georgenia sp. Z1344 TaxID=3416706 RepID=UPI003CE9350C
MGANASTVHALSVPGSPDRENEDASWVGERVVVVADGAGLPKEFRAGCEHTVAWFSHALAEAFGSILERGDSSMTDSLEAALADVRDRHATTCDLASGSPSATVVAWRIGDDDVECLVLCDSSIVVVREDGPLHLTDDRLDQLVHRLAADREEAARVAAAGGTPAPIPRAADLLNTPGGYWVASHDPDVAHRALVTTVRRAEVRHLVAASDGATRSFLEVGTHTLEEFARECAAGRLTELRDAVRAAETARTDVAPGEKRHDDLTVVSTAV